jgi:hypothetical protein
METGENGYKIIILKQELLAFLPLTGGAENHFLSLLGWLE